MGAIHHTFPIVLEYETKRRSFPIVLEYETKRRSVSTGHGLNVRNSIPIVYNGLQEKRCNYAMPYNEQLELRLSHPVPIFAHNPPMEMRHTHPVAYQPRVIVTHSISVDVYLADQKITHLISAVTIEHSEENPHNTIDIQCFAPQLHPVANALVDSGVLTVCTDAQVEKFLLKKVDGSTHSFALFGLSLATAFDNVDTELTISTLQLASAVATNVKTGVSWHAPDWTFDDYGFAGTRMAILKRLSEACGAVARCAVDDSVFVRPMYPVRPIDMLSADYDLIIRESDILEIAIEKLEGDGYNQIDILGPSFNAADIAPEIVVERDPAPGIGKDVFVRAYFPTPTPPVIDASVTAGVISRAGKVTEVITERVTFDGGYAQAKYPIKSIVAFQWSGRGSAPVEASAYSRTLTSSKLWDTGMLTYLTEYVRWRVYGHNTDYIRGQLVIDPGNDFSVRVIMGDGDHQNPDTVQDALIRHPSVAVARAESVFDSTSYNRKIIKIIAPLTPQNKSLTDGRLIYIVCPSEDVVGIAKTLGVKRLYTNKLKIVIKAEICNIPTTS